MKDLKQYTIRNVPASADSRLKAQAKKQGISLNKLLLQKIGALPAKPSRPKIYHDLDWMIGTMSNQEAQQFNTIISHERARARAKAQADYQADKV
jgi:hypothetical protein